LFLIFIGAYLEKRKKRLHKITRLAIDLDKPRDRRILVVFALCSVVFLMLSALGSYQTYHFTESVQFCGQVCHTVMEPEFIAHRAGNHARVACTECHIGPGATWFVRAKVSGSYQVYAVAAKKYPTPIPTPVHNLRPAMETCEQCLWPKKFVGNLDRTFNSFLAEETNTQYSVRMLLRVGGSDPNHGPEGGIHWHINMANRIEYAATDPQRLKIPYVRVTDDQGKVTEYRSPGFTNDPRNLELRRMDCVDCHNRPAHFYNAPNDSVNRAMALKKIDPQLPWIKTNAVHILTQTYTNAAEAVQKIDSFMNRMYPNEPRVKPAIAELIQIYTNNFFPQMKVSWKAYPSHIGHKDWPGCFRCHDGKHKTMDGKQSVKGSDCNACHIILAQGAGKELDQLNAHGQEFKHPGGDYDGLCNDCHTGGL
jgi:nitrate/TMAO reductase-like tetraheme cytochrome c subunit